MSEARWTAPQAGWYHVTTDREPEFLGTDKPVIQPEGSVAVVRFNEGDATMDSGGGIPATGAPMLVIPWDAQ